MLPRSQLFRALLMIKETGSISALKFNNWNEHAGQQTCPVSEQFSKAEVVQNFEPTNHRSHLQFYLSSLQHERTYQQGFQFRFLKILKSLYPAYEFQVQMVPLIVTKVPTKVNLPSTRKIMRYKAMNHGCCGEKQEGASIMRDSLRSSCRNCRC